VSRRYHKASDFEWIQPIRRGYKMACCDCGLVHGVNFRIIKYAGGKRTKVQFQAWRDERATAAKRRRYAKAPR
jgi:hypothetical protein